MAAPMLALVVHALAALQSSPPTTPPAAPPQDPSRQLTVVLKPRAEVRHTPVRLEDVAQCNGAGDDVAHAMALELGPAPPAGHPRKITPAGVMLAARLTGLAIERGQILGAKEVEVSAVYQTLSPDNVLDAAERWLREQLQELGGKALVERGALPDPVPLLDGSGAPEFRCGFVGKSRTAGTVQVKVSVLQGQTCAGERVCTLRVRRFGSQLRLLADTRRGEAIDPGDVLVLDGESTTVTGTPLVDLSELKGFIASRDVASGSVLVREMLERPLLVNRGDQVRLVLRSGALQIVTTGIASKPGRRGEVIPVVNTTTQHVVQAEILEKRATGEVVARVH